MKPELKKLLLLNLPYLLFVYLFAKCGQAYRLAAGADASAKLLHLTSGISAAFANPLPSLHPFDLCVGVAGAVAVRLIVYSKGKNAKKYRKGEEYGSAVPVASWTACPAKRAYRTAAAETASHAAGCGQTVLWSRWQG